MHVSRALCATCVAAGLQWATACGERVFACSQDGDCRDGAAAGVCQPEGVCSFPDPSCASGQRFGAHGGALGGMCVPSSGSASGSAGESTLSGPGTSQATTTASSSSDGESSTTAPVSATGTTGSTDGGTAESSTGEPADPGLLLWFRFDDDLSDGLDNAGALAGTAACVGGCPSPVRGALGSAGSFDGSDDCARYDFVRALGTPQFTLAMWVRRDVAVDGFDSAFAKPVGLDAYNTWRMTVQGNGALGEIVNVHVGLADDSGVDSDAPLPLGVWTHFAATWSGAELTSYLDGELFETLPSNLIEFDDQPVFIGCDDDQLPRGVVHHLHGALDDVRLYDRVLDAVEIAELAAGG